MNIEFSLHNLTIESMPKFEANTPRSNSSVGDNNFNDYHNNKFLLLLLHDLQLKICCCASLILLFEIGPHALRGSFSSCRSTHSRRPQRSQGPRLRHAAMCCAM